MGQTVRQDEWATRVTLTIGEVRKRAGWNALAARNYKAEMERWRARMDAATAVALEPKQGSGDAR